MKYKELNVYRQGKPISIKYIEQEGNDKYGLLPKVIEETLFGVTYKLRRIIALKPFADVRVGQEGGCVESFDNLDYEDDCWLTRNSFAVGSTKIMGSSYVDDVLCVDSIIMGDSDIGGKSTRSYIKKSIIEDSDIYGNIVITNSSLKKCVFECETDCKLDEVDFYNVQTNCTIESVDIIKSKIKNVMLCCDFRAIDVMLWTMESNNVSDTDCIYLYDEHNNEVFDGEGKSISINRALFRGECFNFDRLKEYIDSDGTRKTSEIKKCEIKDEDNIKSPSTSDEKIEEISEKFESYMMLEELLKDWSNEKSQD